MTKLNYFHSPRHRMPASFAAAFLLGIFFVWLTVGFIVLVKYLAEHT